jgi:transmembrane sensor
MSPDDQTSSGRGRPAPLETGEDALAWAVSAGAAGTLVDNLRVRARQRRRRRVAAGATVGAIALMALTVFWPRAEVVPDKLAATASSPIVSAPERRVLADGSVVELKPGAEVTVDFGAKVRRLVLSRGEAHFDVVPDAARPFVVIVGRVEVRAVGTAFSIDHGEAQVEVLVTKGRVAVSETSSPASPAAQPAATEAPSTRPPLALLDAGYRARIAVSTAAAGAPQVAAVSAAEMGTRLAWCVPRLQFSGTPLREVIPMFNRYGAQSLVLDPALGALQMSGVLRADDTESLLLLLKNEFGIVAEPGAGQEIALRRR